MPSCGSLVAMDLQGRETVIVGAGGQGRELLDLIEALARAGSGHRFVGFVDDGRPDLELLAARGVVLLDGVDDPRASGADFVIGIGDPTVRAAVDRRLQEGGRAATDLVHPTSTIGSEFRSGAGLVVCALVSVTTNVRLGRHVHLNPGVTIGHDCDLGDHVSVYPNATISGAVTLGDRVTVGAGSVIIQGLSIGEGTIVGAGAVVTRDLPAGVVAVGSPARPVRDA